MMRNEINAGGERVAMYCSLEAAEGVADPEKGIPIVYSLIQNAARQVESLRGCTFAADSPLLRLSAAYSNHSLASRRRTTRKKSNVFVL